MIFLCGCSPVAKAEAQRPYGPLGPEIHSYTIWPFKKLVSAPALVCQALLSMQKRRLEVTWNFEKADPAPPGGEDLE